VEVVKTLREKEKHSRGGVGVEASIKKKRTAIDTKCVNFKWRGGDRQRGNPLKKKKTDDSGKEKKKREGGGGMETSHEKTGCSLMRERFIKGVMRESQKKNQMAVYRGGGTRSSQSTEKGKGSRLRLKGALNDFLRGRSRLRNPSVRSNKTNLD